MVQFNFGTTLVRLWYRFDSTLVPFGYHHIGTNLVPFWYHVGTIQRWYKFATSLVRLGNTVLVHVGTILVQIWYHFGNTFVQCNFGTTLVPPLWYQYHIGTTLAPLWYNTTLAPPLWYHRFGRSDDGAILVFATPQAESADPFQLGESGFVRCPSLTNSRNAKVLRAST